MDQQDQQPFMLKNYLTTRIVLFVAVFALGFGVSMFIFGTRVWAGQGDKNAYYAGLNAAQARCAELGERSRVQGQDLATTIITPGKVKSISTGTIIVESPSVDSSVKDQSFKILSTTKFIGYESKDQAVFQKENEEFRKSTINATLRGAKTLVGTPPLPFVEKSISLNDIKKGVMVAVESEESTQKKNVFNALKITIVPRGFGGVTLPQSKR